MNSIIKENFQACFVNTLEKPKESFIIGWTATISGDEIILIEVVREIYPHPDAPEQVIQITTTREKERAKRFSIEASKIELLWNAQNNITQQTI